MSLDHLKAMGIDVWQPRACVAKHQSPTLDEHPATPELGKTSTPEINNNTPAEAVQSSVVKPVPALEAQASHPMWQSASLPNVPANQQGDYLVVCADALIEEGAKELVNPFSGQTATLFDGMMKATQWDVMKCVLLHDVSQFNLACESVKPKMIVLLGLQAVRALHPQAKDVASFRAEHSVKPPQHNGIPYVCTFHPNLAVDNAQYKRPIWEDLKRAMAVCA